MKLKKYLIIMILISIVVSIPLIAKRISTENTSKKVDFILDYYQVKELAEQSEKPIEQWLKDFNDMGIGSVGVKFETLESMMEENKNINCDIVKNIKKDPEWRWKYPSELVNFLDSEKNSNYYLVANFGNYEDYEFASEGLKEKYGEKIILFNGKNNNYIVIKSKYKDILHDSTGSLYNLEGKPLINKKNIASSSAILLPIGIDKEKIEIIEKSGMKIMPRLTNPAKGWFSKDFYDSMVEDYQKVSSKSPYMVFGGEEVFGNPKNLDDTIKLLNREKVSTGIIETVVERSYIPVKGMDKYIGKLEYNVNKVYSIPDYVQKRYKYMNYKGAEEIGNVLYRAITERNANLIYFRPFMDKDNTYIENVKEYKNMFNELNERLEKHGITIGETKPYKINYVRKIAVALLGLGTVAAGIMVLNNLFKLREESLTILTIVGILGMLFTVLVLGRTGYMILAIATATIFPSLGIISFTREMKQIYLYDGNFKMKNNIIRGIISFLLTILVTFIGSLIISAIMSSTKNILDIDYFKGVKISQLIPFLVFIVSYVGIFGFKEEKKRGEDKFISEDFYNLMNDTPRVFYFMVLAIIGIVGYVYLARTGHEAGLEPSNIELMFRNILERSFYARPRTKEFLIAFPALIMGVTFATSKFKPGIFLSGLVGVIGVTSILNTFSHFKTPFLVSFSRLFSSIILGIIVGIIYILIIYLINFLLIKFNRRISR